MYFPILSIMRWQYVKKDMCKCDSTNLLLLSWEMFKCTKYETAVPNFTRLYIFRSSRDFFNSSKTSCSSKF